MNPSSMRSAILLFAGLAFVACGGGGEEAAPAGTPASEPPPPETTPAAAEAPETAAAETAAPAETGAAGPAEAEVEQAGQPVQEDEGLVREIFVYRSSGRDPFLPLSSMENVRPFVEDLRVTGITFDARYPGNSIAVLRDTSALCREQCRYTVRVGDEVGQVRVLEIRTSAVIVVREQFGIEQQIVLPLRRQ